MPENYTKSFPSTAANHWMFTGAPGKMAQTSFNTPTAGTLISNGICKNSQTAITSSKV